MKPAIAPLLLLGLSLAGTAEAQTAFTARLNGGQETPPTPSPFTGLGEFVHDASTGLLQVPTPDVVGLDQVQAERVIIASGLTVGARDSVTDRTEVGGVVLGTRPSAGMARAVGASVDLIINGAAR